MFTQLVRLAVLGLFASVAAPTTQPVTAAQIAAPAPVLYRLDAAANLVEGCQEPCKCPLWLNEDLVGTFVLRFDHSEPNWTDVYAVESVNWMLGYGPTAQRITGSGELRVGGQLAVTQQLTLDLSFDGAPPMHFDSGAVPLAAPLPKLDIAVAMNGFFCFDRVFSVVAAPVPQAEVVPFRLRSSTLEVGCQAPCSCPILLEAVAGRFGLVDLGLASDPAHMHYALVDLRWRTRPAAGNPARTYSGFGLYAIDALGAQHRLQCDLSEDGAAPVHFDSGLVPGGIAFAPQIEIDIAQNDFFCFDRVFRLHALP